VKRLSLKEEDLLIPKARTLSSYLIVIYSSVTSTVIVYNKYREERSFPNTPFIGVAFIGYKVILGLL